MRLQGPRSPQSGVSATRRTLTRRRATMFSSGKRFAALAAAVVTAMMMTTPDAARAAGTDPCGPGATPSRVRTASRARRRASGTSSTSATARFSASPPRPASSRGQPVSFKIKATSAYSVDIYRLGNQPPAATELAARLPPGPCRAP